MMRMTGTVAKAELFDQVHLVGVWEKGLATEEDLGDGRFIVRLKTSPLWDHLGPVGRILQLAQWNWKIARHYQDRIVSVVNPHIVWALPVSAWMKNKLGSKVIYDTHELETETIGSRGLRQKLSRWIEARYISICDVIHVVSSGIEAWYQDRYKLENVHTIKNYPLQSKDRPASTKFRDQFGIPNGHLIFCYQGRLSRATEIEMLLEVFRNTSEDKHLVFMGFGPLADQLEATAEKASNLHFQPGVPFDQVPAYTGSADVAIVLFEDACLSYHHVLPNKLLESLNAGVPVIASNLPDMKAELATDNAGWIVENDVKAVTALLDRLDKDAIKSCKEGAQAWSHRNHWDVEGGRMLQLYEQILGR